MAKLSFYEQVGIIVPGAVFLGLLLILFPNVQALIPPQNLSAGELGLFLIAAYAAGHAIAALGNFLEKAWWYARGGMPSDWVVRPGANLLTDQQLTNLAAKIRSKLNLQVEQIVGMDRRQWSPIFAQVYRCALSSPSNRIEAFNGNYGLNRGLAAALCAVAVIVLALQPDTWRVSVALLAAAAVYLYRMNRFAVNFAREVFLVFLNLSD